MDRDRSIGCGQSRVGMSPRTIEFLQKFCYKSPASVDMTQYGFICDSKVTPVNLLLKPLRQKLEEICGPSEQEKKKRISLPVKPVSSMMKPPELKAILSTKRQKAKAKGNLANCHKGNLKVPMAPRPSPINLIKKTITEAPVPVRKSRVTFEEPCITLMKNRKKNRRSFNTD